MQTNFQELHVAEKYIKFSNHFGYVHCVIYVTKIIGTVFLSVCLEICFVNGAQTWYVG